MTAPPPTVLWVRRDLRLCDNAALAGAVARGGAVIPVFIDDPVLRDQAGAAPLWRLSRGLAAFDAALRRAGSRLIYRRGPALETLRALVAETGASAVVWTRLYDPQSIARDTAVKAALKGDGLAVDSAGGWLLHEPQQVTTKTGDFYKVYTPFWRACLAGDPPPHPVPAVAEIPAPAAWPDSLTLDALGLETAMNRGAAVLARHVPIGEAVALARLKRFLEGPVRAYDADRDRLDRDGTSRLSAHFATGELSPRTAWWATREAMAADPSLEAGATVFLKEIVWREFAAHLSFHTPHIHDRNWRQQWDAFPWRGDNDDAETWRRGRTGVPVIDAAMRELYATGVMHNRARMLVASYLTKNLLTHWRVGEAWFRDCLVDWDAASNAMGWQWAAGSGPDAAPYFRIFNPDTQAQKFDPAGAYIRRWAPEAAPADLMAGGPVRDGAAAGDFYAACPRRWGLGPDTPYPKPRLSLAEGRAQALSAYEVISKSKQKQGADA